MKKENKIRSPISYLKKQHGVPKYLAEPLINSAVFHKKYWKKDKTGYYISRYQLDSLGYGYKNDRKTMEKLAKEASRVNIRENNIEAFLRVIKQKK